MSTPTRPPEAPAVVVPSAPVSPVAPEATPEVRVIDGERKDVHDVIDVVTGEVMLPGQRAAVRKQILKDLKNAGDATARMRALATVLDVFGVDTIMGLIPWIGDWIVAPIAVLYTFKQIYHVKGMGCGALIQTMGYHLFDVVVGMVADLGTPVVAGVVDYAIRPNQWMADTFDERLAEMIDEAESHGISRDEITGVLKGAMAQRDKWLKRGAPIEDTKRKALEKLSGGLLGAKPEDKVHGALEGPAAHPAPATPSTPAVPEAHPVPAAPAAPAAPAPAPDAHDHGHGH